MTKEYSFQNKKMKTLNKQCNKHWNFKLARDLKLKVKIQIFMISHKVIKFTQFQFMFELNTYGAREKH